jgi:hypothetical protein
MNRSDSIDTANYLALLHAKLRPAYEAETRKREKAKLGKELDEIRKLVLKLRPVKPERKTAEPKPVMVGTCKCGKVIEISPRYSMSIGGRTSVTKVCTGCNRLNEIDLTVRSEVADINWAISDCFCGEPLMARTSYGGEYPYDRPEYRKNRTVGVACRGCGCKWSYKIIFKKENGTIFRHRQGSVICCYRHKNDPVVQAKLTPSEKKS